MFDVVIVGGGAAGLTASIYASRARLKTLLIEKAYPGGQIMMCETIENYPGFKEPISGLDLVEAMRIQAEKFGTEQRIAEIEWMDLLGIEKVLHTVEKEQIYTKTVILCLGARPRLLGVPGEKEFLGRGVSYCATCDGAFFAEKNIVVVGGGDTALEDAQFLTRYASKVTIIHRRDKFRAQKIIQERVFDNPKIEVIWDSVVNEISGNDNVESINIQNIQTGEMSTIETDGVFVLIGNVPNTQLIEGQVELDENGYVKTDSNMQTNINGVFAAGDIRGKLLRQVVTACGDGATAAFAAERYIEGTLH
ncbi:MAG: thioredoxin-disulfide reductase [Armatimonadota bacterium]